MFKIDKENDHLGNDKNIYLYQENKKAVQFIITHYFYSPILFQRLFILINSIKI